MAFLVPSQVDSHTCVIKLPKARCMWALLLIVKVEHNNSIVAYMQTGLGNFSRLRVKDVGRHPSWQASLHGSLYE